MSCRLLGAHVGRRAKNRARGGHLDIGLDPLGKAEVGDVRVSFPIHQDVRRFQVSVQDSAHVGVMNRLGGLSYEGCRRLWSRLERREQLGKVSAFHKLHREVALAFMLTDFVNRHDPHVVEQRNGLGFVLEPF